MPYAEKVLPVTGGGAFLGAMGMFYGWILALVAVILVLSLYGSWRLYKGKKDLGN